LDLPIGSDALVLRGQHLLQHEEGAPLELRGNVMIEIHGSIGLKARAERLTYEPGRHHISLRDGVRARFTVPETGGADDGGTDAAFD